jgi:hypothetical protein
MEGGRFDELVTELRKIGRGEEEIRKSLNKLEQGTFFDLRLDIMIAHELKQRFRNHKLFRVFTWGFLGKDGSINIRFGLKREESLPR